MKRFAEWLTNKWLPAEQKDYHDALRRLFSSSDGRYVLHKWMDEIYCQTSFVQGGRCCDTAFQEGQRNFIHALLQTLDMSESPEKYVKAVITKED